MPPTYEFACSGCNQGFELVRSMNDDSVAVCPNCGDVGTRTYHPTAALIPGGTPIHHDRAWLRGPGGRSQERK